MYVQDSRERYKVEFSQIEARDHHICDHAGEAVLAKDLVCNLQQSFLKPISGTRLA